MSLFGASLNPTNLVDLTTRLGAAFATGGQSELVRLAVNLSDDVIAEVAAELPAPAREALQSAYLSSFAGALD